MKIVKSIQMRGKFKSILNVNPKNQVELNKSIKKVILLLKNNKDIFCSRNG